MSGPAEGEGRRPSATLVEVRLGRPGAVRRPAVRLSARAALLLLAGSAVGLLLLGAAAGRLWESARQDRSVERLEARLVGLENERRRLGSLAAKLEAMEAEYRRIRQALGVEISERGRAVALPPLAPATEPETGSASGAGTPWAWPLAQRGFVTRDYGSLLEGQSVGTDPRHSGFDIAVPQGSYVRAAAAGVVSEAATDETYGLHLRIAHGEGLASLYAHNSWIFVAAGDTVERLEVIALSGNTGRSTAPHLHFEVTRYGERQDPARYLSVGR